MNKCVSLIVIETDAFGMENIFEQMSRFKGTSTVDSLTLQVHAKVLVDRERYDFVRQCENSPFFVIRTS